MIIRMEISLRITASMPYANEKVISPVLTLGDVLYAHMTPRSSLAQLSLKDSSFFFNDFKIAFLDASACSFPWRSFEVEKQSWIWQLSHNINLAQNVITFYYILFLPSDCQFIRIVYWNLSSNFAIYYGTQAYQGICTAIMVSGRLRNGHFHKRFSYFLEDQPHFLLSLHSLH